MVAMNLNTNTYVLNGTTSSSNITLSPQDANTNSLIVYNAGPNDVMLVSGTGAAPTAIFPTNAAPQPGTVFEVGSIITMTKKTTDEFISGICLTGTATVYISPGAGE